MLQFKNIILIFILMSSFAKADVPDFPKSVTGFNIYVKNKIMYHNSDFQGVVGAGDSIDLVNFSILNLMTNRTYKLPYKYSIITKDFSLTNGTVFLGGTFASNYLDIQNSRLSSPVVSDDSEFRRARSVTNRPSFNKYAQQMDKLENQYRSKLSIAKEPKLINSRFYQDYLNIKAVDHNGTLANYYVIDQLNKSMVFDAQNMPREYFVVLVTSSQYQDIQGIDFKLINGASQNKILFVFLNSSYISITSSGASSLSGIDLGIGIPGSILAAHSRVKFTEDLLTGALYAKSLNGDFYGTDANDNEIMINGGQINNGKFVCFEFQNCKDPNDRPNN